MLATDINVRAELVREVSSDIWSADGSPNAVETNFADDFVDHEPSGLRYRESVAWAGVWDRRGR